MNWVDIAGWLSWLAAYLLAVYAVHAIGRSPWRYVFPFAGLAVGVAAYVVVAWRFGRWPALGTGLVLCVAAAVAIATRARRPPRPS